MPLIAPEAVADLDEIAFYIATQSGSLTTATRFISSLADRFSWLANHPFWADPGIVISVQDDEAMSWAAT